jgi:hypothetical protein
MKPSYTIEHHKHIEAAWGAATGARASILCRFPVSVGRQILEESGFTARFKVSDLPLPAELDQRHAQWRYVVIKNATKRKLKYTHGIAAKLINGYLKIRFVCGGDHEHERVRFLHPPIDAVLLAALADADYGGQAKAWRKFHDMRWSKFDSATYQTVIELMRRSLPAGAPLWHIEAYWKGHQ